MQPRDNRDPKGGKAEPIMSRRRQQTAPEPGAEPVVYTEPGAVANAVAPMPVAAAITQVPPLRSAGIPLLNQAVLLKGVNDDAVDLANYTALMEQDLSKGTQCS